jgi:hypothetical protein
VAQMLTVIASAVGPLCFALCHRWTASYNPMFFGLSILVALFGVAAWLVPLPVPIEQGLRDAGRGLEQ